MPSYFSGFKSSSQIVEKNLKFCKGICPQRIHYEAKFENHQLLQHQNKTVKAARFFSVKLFRIENKTAQGLENLPV